jgi:hypothetical protein
MMVGAAYLLDILMSAPDEVALAVACAFNDPKDLVRLGLVFKRYSDKCIAPPRHTGHTAAVHPELWSIVDEAGRPVAPEAQ